MKSESHRASTHQPHDKLVRRLLSSPETARDVLTLYLPNEEIYPDSKQFWMAFQGNFSDKVENKMATFWENEREEARQEGLEQGLEQGLQQGRMEAAGLMEKGIEKGLMQTAKRLFEENKMLGHAELIEWVHRITGLPVDKLASLLTAKNYL